MDERIRQSQEYVQQARDRRSGVSQKEMQEIRESQKDWRAQVEKIIQAEIDIEARKH